MEEDELHQHASEAEKALARARREAQDAIVYAHQAMEIVCLLARDMQSSGALRPATKTAIQNIFRDGHDGTRTRQIVDGTRSRFRDNSTLEREQKRETPKG